MLHKTERKINSTWENWKEKELKWFGKDEEPLAIWSFLKRRLRTWRSKGKRIFFLGWSIKAIMMKKTKSKSRQRYVWWAKIYMMGKDIYDGQRYVWWAKIYMMKKDKEIQYKKKKERKRWWWKNAQPRRMIWSEVRWAGDYSEPKPSRLNSKHLI